MFTPRSARPAGILTPIFHALKPTPATALLSVLLGCGILPVQGHDYPHWRGPQRTGISTETEWSTSWPSTGPKVLWKSNVGIGFASVSVADGRAYTTGNRDDQDTVYCFDAAQGDLLWHYAFPSKLDAKYYEGGTSATPTVDGDRVYILSKRGQLICFNVADGSRLWNKNLESELDAKVPTWGFASSPLILGDTLYLNVGTSGTALNKQNGNLVWTTGKDAAGYATPLPYTMNGQDGLAVFGAKYLYGIDPKNGTELWNYRWKTSYDVNAADPIIQGNRVFLSSGYGSGSAVIEVQGNTVREIWRNKELKNKFNSSILIDGYLYGFDEKNPNNLKCLSFADGSLQWDVEDLGNGSLMAADGKLIVLSEKGELLIAPATPDAFEPVARAQVLEGKCWTTPVLSNARIYCRNAAGDLVCLDVSKP